MTVAPPLSTLAAALAIAATGAAAETGTLSLFANGESLATEGFLPPELTSDGWELRFDQVLVTVEAITAMQTDPPYDAGSGDAAAATVTAPLNTLGRITLDLTDGSDDGRVLIGSIEAPAGHYNALSWSVAPAEGGDWAGHSMVLIGTASKDGQTVDFTLTSADRHDYLCGEYVGDRRKGFLGDGGTADLELTFHLDHIFGRADKAAEDPMNQSALGFDAFAGGGVQVMDLNGLHIGHVGEGHCAVTYR